MSIYDDLTQHMPRELQEAMEAAIADQRYETHADILLDALFLWLDREMLGTAKLEQLRQMVEEGRKGPTYSVDEVFAELRQRVAARQEQAQAAE